MGLLKAIQHQIGLSTTITQNFTITAESADGTLQIQRGVPGNYTATPLTIDALNNLIAAVTPPVGDRSKKLMTTEMLGTEFAISFTTPGWQKLPSGLIMQWGNTPIGATSRPITFPIPFPNVPIFVIHFDAGWATGTNGSKWGATLKTATGFTAWTDTAGEGGTYLAFGG